MLVKLMKNNVTGKEIEHLLDECRITVNKNAVPNDPQSPFITSGIRVGTPSVTTRGMKEPEMEITPRDWPRVTREKEAALDDVRETVAALCDKYPLYAGM